MTIVQVEDLFKDAEHLYAEGVKELNVGKVRNAAEKAWAATLRATNGLILARTGEIPPTTALTSVRLHRLSDQDPDVEQLLVGRYHTRESLLHGRCFYEGLCEPEETVRRRIIETRQYIEDAKKLALDSKTL